MAKTPPKELELPPLGGDRVFAKRGDPNKPFEWIVETRHAASAQVFFQGTFDALTGELAGAPASIRQALEAHVADHLRTRRSADWVS